MGAFGNKRDNKDGRCEGVAGTSKREKERYRSLFDEVGHSSVKTQVFAGHVVRRDAGFVGSRCQWNYIGAGATARQR